MPCVSQRVGSCSAWPCCGSSLTSSSTSSTVHYTCGSASPPTPFCARTHTHTHARAHTNKNTSVNPASPHPCPHPCNHHHHQQQHHLHHHWLLPLPLPIPATAVLPHRTRFIQRGAVSQAVLPLHRTAWRRGPDIVAPPVLPAACSPLVTSPWRRLPATGYRLRVSGRVRAGAPDAPRARAPHAVDQLPLHGYVLVSHARARARSLCVPLNAWRPAAYLSTCFGRVAHAASLHPTQNAWLQSSSPCGSYLAKKTALKAFARLCVPVRLVF